MGYRLGLISKIRVQLWLEISSSHHLRLFPALASPTDLFRAARFLGPPSGRESPGALLLPGSLALLCPSLKMFSSLHARSHAAALGSAHPVEEESGSQVCPEGSRSLWQVLCHSLGLKRGLKLPRKCI